MKIVILSVLREFYLDKGESNGRSVCPTSIPHYSHCKDHQLWGPWERLALSPAAERHSARVQSQIYSCLTHILEMTGTIMCSYDGSYVWEVPSRGLEYCLSFWNPRCIRLLGHNKYRTLNIPHSKHLCSHSAGIWKSQVKVKVLTGGFLLRP
jgi:hypothetical protein